MIFTGPLLPLRVELLFPSGMGLSNMGISLSAVKVISTSSLQFLAS
jgi:hypothetical protein